jgi:hypothetical protein
VLPIINSVLEWASRPAVLTTLFASSSVSLIASVIALPWYLKRLPPDYFVTQMSSASLGPATRRVRATRAKTLSESAFLVAKNVVGGLLVLAGIAMLVLPGQGIATIVVGLLMMQFPGKRRLERRLLSIPPVLRAVNRMRVRNGQPELQMPAKSSAPSLGASTHGEPQSIR